jgi:hypothetical protein
MINQFITKLLKLKRKIVEKLFGCDEACLEQHMGIVRLQPTRKDDKNL